MKGIQKRWLAAGAFALVLLSGCVHEGYAYRDRDDDWRYRHHRRYEGRAPGYYQGGDVDVYVAPRPEPVRPRRW